MSIWTSSKVVVGIILGLSLAACDTGGDGFSLFDRQPSDQTEKPRRNVALTSAEMARGVVSLRPPAGFCIDKQSLKQNFAIVARCDSLGGKGGALDAPLGMILVSVAPAQGPVDLAAMQSLLLNDQVDVLRRIDEDGLSLVQVSGDAPDRADPLHWRGVAQIGSQVVSLLAFAPQGGPMKGPEGGTILRALVRETRDSSIAADVARKENADDDTRKRPLGGLLSSLFD